MYAKFIDREEGGFTSQLYPIGKKSFCGRYEHPEDADFLVDEIFLKDGELHARAIDEDGDEMSFRLYPIGENEFGRKGGLLKLTFGDGCLMYDDFTCRKL